MSDFSSVVLNTRLWAMVCLGALGLTVLLSLLGHIAGPRIWGASPEETGAAGQVMLPIFFGLFLVLGFSALPLAANLFVSGLERLWTSTGLLERPLHAKVMAVIHQQQVRFVVVVWALLLVGLVIAAPHIMRDWAAGRSSPVSAPKGAMPSLEYQVRHAKQILFFSEPGSTGRTLFELLLPAPDGTITYPAYAAPPDTTIAKTLTLDELRKMIASQR